MSPELLAFVAQSAREAACVICSRNDCDDWDERHESLRLTTPFVKESVSVLVHLTTCRRLTTCIPKLSLETLFAPETSG